MHNQTHQKRVSKWNWWPQDSWRHLLLAGLVMVLVSLMWEWVSIPYTNNLLDQKRIALQSQADEIAVTITSRVNQRQALLLGLAAFVKTHSVEELRSQKFAEYTASLLAGDPIIRAILYYPLEGAGLVNPPEGNESIVGSTLADLRSTDRENVRSDVQRAIETGQITLSEPYELRQGGRGVVARLAVYDQAQFQGLVAVVLNLDPLLAVPGLSPAPADVQFAMKDGLGEVFFGEQQVFSSDPVLAVVGLPEGSWSLGASPRSGWSAGFQRELWWFWLMASLMVLMSGGLTYLIFSRQATLKRLVRQRTAALAESEARYVTVLSLVNEAIWDWNIQKEIGFASENFYTLLGYTAEATLSYELWLTHVHPEDVGRARQAMQQAVDTGQGFQIDLRMHKQNGEWIHVQVIGRVVAQDPSGKALRIVGTVADISIRKIAEDQLRASEAKFRAIFENNHIPMLLLIPETGEIIDANPAACSFYGWSHAELITKKSSQINVLSESELKVEMLKAVHAQRRFFHFRHRLANQEIRDVEVISGPIVHNGKILLYSIVQDITARIQAERLLEESEARYRQLLQVAPIGIAVHSEGKIIFANPASARLLGGESPEQIIGKHLNEIIHPDYLMRLQDRLKMVLSPNTPSYANEDVLIKLDGSTVDVEIMSAAIMYQGNPATQVVVSDITERRKSQEKILATQTELKRLLIEADESRRVLLSVIEDQKIAEEKIQSLNAELEQRVSDRTAQLEAANKELEAFSYSVSHDLRSPLRGIDGWSLALLEDCQDQLDENGRTYLARVRAETQRMGQLIDDLLRLSRVTRLGMRRGPVNLSEIAQVIADRLREENPERTIEFEIQPDLTDIGDQNLLEIVLTNLLSNAVKFTARQPQAVIQFNKTIIENQPVYIVRDNGVGFDMEYAKNLFGAFQRMHRQSDFPGTGIGLATVQRIIHRHGGRVWADARLNQGAAFHFTLTEEK